MILIRINIFSVITFTQIIIKKNKGVSKFASPKTGFVRFLITNPSLECFLTLRMPYVSITGNKRLTYTTRVFGLYRIKNKDGVICLTALKTSTSSHLTTSHKSGSWDLLHSITCLQIYILYSPTEQHSKVGYCI